MFDLRTHIRNLETGVVEEKAPYQRHVWTEGVGIDRVRYSVYERDGKFYDEAGDEVEAPSHIIQHRKDVETIRERNKHRGLKKAAPATSKESA